MLQQLCTAQNVDVNEVGPHDDDGPKFTRKPLAQRHTHPNRVRLPQMILSK